jgi:hypothetical protein
VIEKIIIRIGMRNGSEKKQQHQPYMVRRYALSESKTPTQKDPIVFMAIDEQHIGMYIPFSLSGNNSVKLLVKENHGSWCPLWKLWRIPRTSYTPVRAEIPRLLP